MDYESLILIFTAIVYEALPFVVLGVIIAGLLEEFVPQQAIAKFIPRSRVMAIGLGGVLGIVFPMCECGIIVVMKRLLRKGLPLSVCVAYVLAGPIINVVVMTSTFVAFNPPDERSYILGGPFGVVALRVGLAYIIAVVTSLVVERLSRKHGMSLLAPAVMKGLKSQAQLEAEDQRPRTWMDRLNNITQTALHDFVDIMAFLILGACLAAAGRMFLREYDLEQFLQGSPVVAIMLMMVIAVLFACAARPTPSWPPTSGPFPPHPDGLHGAGPHARHQALTDVHARVSPEIDFHHHLVRRRAGVRVHLDSAFCDGKLAAIQAHFSSSGA